MRLLTIDPCQGPIFALDGPGSYNSLLAQALCCGVFPSLPDTGDSRVSPSQEPRRHPIRTRWIDVLAVGLSAGALFVLAAPFISSGLCWYREETGDIGVFVTLVLGLGVLVHAPRRHNSAQFPARLGCEHPWRYPPHWLGAIIGIPLVILFGLLGERHLERILGIDHRTTGAWWGPLLGTWGALLLLTLLVLLFAWLFKTFPPYLRELYRGPLPRARDSLEPPPLEQFQDWARSDEPIGSVEHDRFGSERIAERIERIIRLVDWDRRDEASLAILGDVGSGKSSVLQLVANRIDGSTIGDRRVATVSVGVWPYATEGAALSAVLGSIIDAMSDHVDVLGLRGVPQSYTRVIGTGGGLLERLGELLSHHASPEEVLELIEPALEAARLTIVIFVEDVGRYAPGGTKRSHHLQALLHLLDRRRGLIVVAAVERLTKFFDVHKVVRHVELIPELSPRHVVEQLILLGTWCRARSEGLVILQRAPDLAVIPPNQPEVLTLLFSDTSRLNPDWRAALVRMLSNPRRLKSALRHVMAVWADTAGEIDLDHVIVLSSIRSVSMPVFEVIANHLRSVGQSGQDSAQGLSQITARAIDSLASRKPGTPSPLDLLARDLGVVLREHSEADRMLADLLALVGVLNEHLGKSPNIPGVALQGVQNPHYLARFMSPGPVLEEERDQPVLQAIVSWNEQRSNVLPTMIDGSERGEGVRSFAPLLKLDRFPRLFARVVRRLHLQSAAEWKGTHPWEHTYPDDLVQLRQIAGALKIDQSKLFECLRLVLPKLARTHIPLGDAIIRWFVNRTSGVDPILSMPQVEELQKSFRASLGACFQSGTAGELETAIRGGVPHTCFWASWGLDRLRTGTVPDLPFPTWLSFAEALVELAEQSPRVGIPQLLPFVVRDDDSGPSVRKVWNAAGLRKLFPDAERVRRLLATATADDSWDEDTLARFKVAQAQVAHSKP